MSDNKDFSEHCLLLVEDDEIMRMSLEDRLNLEGICVRAVGDVTSARNELQKGKIDLVFTDIRLPDGTGIDLFFLATIFLNILLYSYFGSINYRE